MSRPLALIEGDLTIPLPRPFDGLPPPFGSRYRALREAVHRAVSEIAEPARARRFPPGVKHVLFYKVPPQRVQDNGFDAAMAEAKRYLEMSKARPRSSRSDHIMAGAIFTGCSIALTWLLVTCSMKDAEKPRAAAVSSAITAWKAELNAEKPTPAVDGGTLANRKNADAPSMPQIASAASVESLATAAPKHEQPGMPTPTAMAAQPIPATPSASETVSEIKSRSLAVPSQTTQVESVKPAASSKVVQAEPTRPAAPGLVESSRSLEPNRVTQAAQTGPVAKTQVVAAASPSYAVSKHVALASSVVSKQVASATAQSGGNRTSSESAAKTRKAVRLFDDSQVGERSTSNRVAKLTTKQLPERLTPRHTADDESVSQDKAPNADAPWLNWSAPQNRAVQTMRAAVPLPGDNSWNDHMTQRRITDDPDAFHVDRSGQ
ncbi:hypothetical protein [Paraburkholderia sp. DHOC27]|uniref:hypothetical protein n=1 Tax=Paraburkholderia sp. DHOC27 TaxID=2303330 RepID=UPI000E3D221B|nr:hypothetical protein [Paraburkholderia sp. DHOC27]RFU48759.1 hypothetical protein D0B32_02680 [Paraburkholderia sp. DHOC27]